MAPAITYTAPASDACERDEGEEIPAERIEEGELEDVEADVLAEHGIHLAERLPMTEQQPVLPLGSRRRAPKSSASTAATAVPTGCTRRRSTAIVSGPSRVLSTSARGEIVRIAIRRLSSRTPKATSHGRAAERALGRERSDEHVLVARFAEPQPVCIERDRGRQDDRKDEKCADDGNPPASFHEHPH